MTSVYAALRVPAALAAALALAPPLRANVPAQGVVVVGTPLPAQSAQPVRPALAAQRGDSADDVPAIVGQATIDTSQVVNFRVLAVPDTVYVGEQVTYQLGVFLDQSVRDRLRRMEAIAPEMRGMMAYDAPSPLSGFPDRSVGARHYQAHVYERAIFPLTAGRLVIPPARLVYAMPLSFSFFSREESYELHSDSVTIVALDPPAEGRPAGWDGAVGSIRVDARVDTSEARVGDAVRLTVSVSGRGNVKLFPRPRLDLDGASAVPAGERVTLSGDSLDVSGVKEFEWLLTPLREGRLVLPRVRYPYFDPAERSYDVARGPVLALRVAPGSLAARETGDTARATWPVRSVYRGALPPAPYERRPFWWVMMLAPLPAVAAAIARRPRRRRTSTHLPSRQLGRLSESASTDARAVRRALLAALALRLRVAASSLADPRDLAHAVRRAGATSETVAEAAALLTELNAAAFSPDGTTPRDLAARADRLYRAVDRESRRFNAPAVRSSALLTTLVALALAVAAHAAAPDRDALQYARGVDAYRRGGYSLAARDFASLARRVPRAADAWANLGTASFAAGDTARAIMGWERALRLEPGARDVRERLVSLGAGGTSGLAGVPAIAPVPLAMLGAILWEAGWLALAWFAARRRAGTAVALAATALAIALALGGAAAALDARLAARDLVVSSRDAPLRLLPALAADYHATLRSGEIAQVTERDGLWVHVAAAGGREGWTASEAVYSIARD